MAYELVYVCDSKGCGCEERVEYAAPMPPGWSCLNVTDRRQWHLCPKHAKSWDDGRGERLRLRSR